jgi:hypothetical protein
MLSLCLIQSVTQVIHVAILRVQTELGLVIL